MDKVTFSELDKAYTYPTEFLKGTLAEFSDTTNEAFKDRRKKIGTLSILSHCLGFLHRENTGAMRTSYLTRVTYNKATKELLVHTRNSVYKFAVIEEGGYEKQDFTWSLPENLRLNYEELVKEAERSYIGF
jgi:enoyl-[acyl-carrier-protein] reductase (NADH)